MTVETNTSGEQGNTINPDDFYANQETAGQESKEETNQVSEQSSEDQNDQKAEDSNENKAGSDEDSSESKEENAKDVELKLPEDSLISKAHFENFKSFAKENGLSNDLAQKLLERDADLLDSYTEAQEKYQEQLINDWREQSLKDPEIGGENLKQNLENCKRAIEKFGSEEFKKQLSETGYGNHPEVVRIFSKIGKLLQDDSLINPSAVSGNSKSIEEIFYGKQN